MRKKISILTTLLLFFGLSLSWGSTAVEGQTIEGQTIEGQAIDGHTIDRHITIDNLVVEKSERDIVEITFDLNIDAELKMRANDMISIFPVIRMGEEEMTLHPIYIYSNRRYLLQERKKQLPPHGSYVVKREKRKDQIFKYVTSFHFEEWIADGDLEVDSYLCGCRNLTNPVSNSKLTDLAYLTPIPPAPVIPPLPETYYCLPVAEDVKQRVQHGRAFVSFPINRTEIFPEYHDNVNELKKIDNTVSGFDPEAILMIRLHGFASPEGPYDNNARLAEGRTRAVRKYITDKFGIPQSKISINFTPENWEGLMEFIVESDLKNKDELLAICKRDLSPNQKKVELKKDWATYKYITDNWLPLLRYTNYEISYVVPNFTPEEAREHAKKAPHELSIRELYEVANLYEVDSKEFYEMIDLTLKLYPDSPEANLNAATAALRRGEIELAKRYMEKATHTHPAVDINKQYIQIFEEYYNEK